MFNEYTIGMHSVGVLPGPEGFMHCPKFSREGLASLYGLADGSQVDFEESLLM